MTCEELLDLVSSGEEGVENRPEFIEHVQGCTRCRDDTPAVLAAARAIRAAPLESLAGHPAAEEIVELAMSPEASALESNRRVAEHVAACSTCSAELEEVRRAERKRSSGEQASPAPRALLGRPGNALANLIHGPFVGGIALATSLGLLLLAYPAMLGLRNLPRATRQLTDLNARVTQLEGQIRDLSSSLAAASEEVATMSHWAGPARLLALTSPLRGQAHAPAFSIDAKEPYVLVSARPILAASSADSDVYRFAIVSTSGREVWGSEVRVAEIRRQMSSSGALFFPVPSKLLAPGKYELRMFPPDDPREPSLQIPFMIAPAT